MKHIIQKPRDFINPLLSKRSVIQNDFEQFEANLEKLLHVNTNESEEHQKNAVREFLVHSFGYTINTKGKIDWAIFKDGKVEVLIEAKRLDNVSEMITSQELNKKALHEAILYFMEERDAGNNELKHIIILTAFKWFVFDAKEFDRLFWNNKRIKKIYTDFKSPSLLGDKTKDFYEAIAKNLTDEIEITVAHFDLKKPQTQKELIAIYKLLSPNALLKAFNPNDANSLNREFYSELLYILGLEEVKEGGKKLIGRAKSPQVGSLYENIAEKLTQYRKPSDFESIIKLMIIWINRILFLKLLESQIVKWNANPSFRFLNANKIDDFDKLEMLFFEVLPKRPMDRNHREFDYIPYLNSSLFELHEMEEKSLKISNLADDANIAYYTKTVIKDEKSTKKTGQICTLHYLFEFLDAYDFSSEGSEEVVSDNKTLINASVLGLIFEKLNGYKDGSFYTPSFITMYMAKESLTKAVLAKFLTCKGWDCQNLTELHNKIEDIKEANDIINSLTLCDPAVGSGHFLVSALNEILSIKATLGILCDAEGKRLKGYRLELANDELIVKDDEGEIFEYQRASGEKTRVQKALFKEKQRIIENSLFGVDINPNSVNICRLRLWIELLKNAYYKEDGTLDTLPNIDINIKCGNSLISRFDLKDELKIKNIKHEIENYKRRVSDYKENLGTKKEVMESINALKAKFNLSLKAEWKIQKALELKLKGYVTDFGHVGLSDMLILTAFRNQYGQIKSLFGDEVDEKKRLKLLGEVQKGEAQVDEIEKGKIYENAFEWRFEFPEVLDEKGDFIGFDVVIGNPPYVFARENFTTQEKSFFVSQYKLSAYQLNLYILFLEKSSSLLNKGGQLSFIVPNNWLTINSAKTVREFILSYSDIAVVNFTAKVFDEANVDTAIVMYKKDTCNPIINLYESSGIEGMHLVKTAPVSFFMAKADAIINIEAFKNTYVYGIIDKIEAKAMMLNEVADVKAGVQAYELGKGKPLQTEAMKKNRIYHANEPLDESYFIYLDGKDVSRYVLGWSGEFLKYGENLAASRKFELFSKPRILVRQIPSQPPYCIHACYTDETILNDRNSMNIVNITKHPLFILALLNSRLLSFWFVHKFGKLSRGIFPQFKINELEQFPIVQTDNENPFITLVDKILTCKASNPKAETAELEAQIDKMVYQLYDLSEEEIAIIEGKQ